MTTNPSRPSTTAVTTPPAAAPAPHGAAGRGAGAPGTAGTDHSAPGSAASEATATVNGSPVAVHEGLTLTHAVARLTGREITPDGTAADGHPLGIAVAVEDTVVPRSLWATTALAPGQNVEIVTAVQGG